MRKEHVVHFVCFETPLDTAKFIEKWEQFSRSAKSDLDVTIQQSEKNGSFKYIVQHRCTEGGFQFVFERGRKSPKTREVEVRVEMAGGYSSISSRKKPEAKPGETKLFVFLTDAQTDIELFKNINIPHELNIYHPYYENCKYTCILEFYTPNKNAVELLQQLKQYAGEGAAMYRECSLQLS
jgi:hypothetical protein